METTLSRYPPWNDINHSAIQRGVSGWLGFGMTSASRSTPPGLLRHMMPGDASVLADIRLPTAYRTGESNAVVTSPAASVRNASRQASLLASGLGTARIRHAT